MTASRLAAAGLVAIVIATACGGLAAKGTAETAIVKFHAQLDAAKYDEIWSEADEGFRKGSSQADASAFLEAIHRKLGLVVSTAQTAFVTQERAGTENAGSFISFTYETSFVEGKGTEKFTWRVDGQRVRLFGYNISSTALILK